MIIFGNLKPFVALYREIVHQNPASDHLKFHQRPAIYDNPACVNAFSGRETKFIT